MEGTDTAAKDQQGTLGSAPGAPPSSADAPVAQVIPHALAKLEKPEDEIYTGGALHVDGQYERLL